ncbi:hypothetical protein GCM10023205_52640 [Yinghuangia aomiensis]|uniref:Uncharacterized protein n=1 Tax=Yinghuangia aomiensis TaxID=676205 RepID=A0ABP9HU69_9ACTN
MHVQTTDRSPEGRAALVEGLRKLADWLAEHPSVKLPLYMPDFTVYVGSAEYVEAFAETFGVAVASEFTAPDKEKTWASLPFGPVSYDVLTYTTVTDLDRIQRLAEQYGLEVFPKSSTPELVEVPVGLAGDVAALADSRDLRCRDVVR